MKDKQRENLINAQAKEDKLELVDYSFNHISKINIQRLVSLKQGIKRKEYNYQQFKRQGYTYSAWLAARSKEYAEKGYYYQ